MNELTKEQENEFALNRLGYYCRVRTQWNQKRHKSDYLFDIVIIENDQDVVIRRGTRAFEADVIGAIKERDKVIEMYLNKLKNN